ncbi:MAG: hypothetical protein H5T61_11885 [Thermoflexales bacterium]|nr:hypothetical protein [Thermoflexales bacterium]
MARQDRWIALGVFLFLLSVYLASYSGHIHSVDEAHIVAVTASLGKGRPDVNQVAFYLHGFDRIGQIGVVGPEGDVFCKKGLAVSLLAVPFFWIFGLLPGAGAVHAAHLTNGVVTALTGSILYLYLTALGFSQRTALLSSLLWGTGTLAWPYARMLFAEPVGALGLTAGLYGGLLFRQRPTVRAAFLTGFGAGLAVLAVPSSALLLPLLGIPLLLPFLRSHGRRILRDALIGGLGGITIPLGIMFAYNAWRFGNPLDTGYRLSLSDLRFPLIGTIGLLFTPARGLFFYSPVALLAVPGYILGWRRYRTDFVLSLALFGAFLLFYGSWVIWHGGWSWGPRYLVPVLPLLFAPVARTLESFGTFPLPARGLVALVLVVSVLAQVVGVAADYVQTEFVLEKDPQSHPDQWFYRGRALLWDPFRSPLVVQARNLRLKDLDLGWMTDGRPDPMGFAAVLLALSLGGTGLGSTLAPRPLARSLTMGGAGLLLCAGVLVVRSTEKALTPFRGDGRLEALTFVAAHREPGDGLVSDNGYLYEFILEQYPDLPPAYIPPAAAEVAFPILDLALSRHSRVWFIGGYVLPDDSGRWVERWLFQNAFPLQAWDFAYHHLSLFSTPGETLLVGEPNAILGGAVQLRAFRLAHRRGQTEEVLQLTLYWEALALLQRDYHVFVHAYDPTLNLLAQADHAPGDNLRPTLSWQPGEIVEDRVAFPLPMQALEAGFALAVGMYDLQSPKDRLPVRTPEGVAPDGRVWLIPPGRPFPLRP